MSAEVAVEVSTSPSGESKTSIQSNLEERLISSLCHLNNKSFRRVKDVDSKQLRREANFLFVSSQLYLQHPRCTDRDLASIVTVVADPFHPLLQASSPLRMDFIQERVVSSEETLVPARPLIQFPPAREILTYCQQGGIISRYIRRSYLVVIPFAMLNGFEPIVDGEIRCPRRLASDFCESRSKLL